jgi:hypothetical protein
MTSVRVTPGSHTLANGQGHALAVTPQMLHCPGASRVGSVSVSLTVSGNPGAMVVLEETTNLGIVKPSVAVPVGTTRKLTLDLSGFARGVPHAGNDVLTTVNLLAGDGPTVHFTLNAQVRHLN